MRGLLVSSCMQVPPGTGGWHWNCTWSSRHPMPHKGLLGSAAPDCGGQGRVRCASLSKAALNLTQSCLPWAHVLATAWAVWTDEDNGWSELASLGRRAYQQNDKFRIFEDIWSAVPQPVTDRDYNGKPLVQGFWSFTPSLARLQSAPADEQWRHRGPSFFFTSA